MKNEENKIKHNNTMNDNYKDNLNEVKNEFLNNINNSLNNIDNLKKNDNLFASNEFLSVNFNLNKKNIYNYMKQFQDEKMENNENKEDKSNCPKYFQFLLYGKTCY